MDELKMQALGLMAEEVDANSPEAQAQQAQAAAAEQKSEIDAKAWAFIPAAVGRLARVFAGEKMAPVVEHACSDEAAMAWGRDMVAVQEKYGWNAPTSLPEINAFISTAGWAAPVGMVLYARLAEFKASKANAPAAPPAAAVVATPTPADVSAVGAPVEVPSSGS